MQPDALKATSFDSKLSFELTAAKPEMASVTGDVVITEAILKSRDLGIGAARTRAPAPRARRGHAGAVDARRAVVHSHALHARWVGDPARRRDAPAHWTRHRRHGRPARPGPAPWPDIARPGRRPSRPVSPVRLTAPSVEGVVRLTGGELLIRESAVPARRPERRGAVQRRPPDARRRQRHGQRRAARSQRVDAPAGQRKAGRRHQDRHTRDVARSAARAAQRHRHGPHLFGTARRAVHPRRHDHRGRCRVPGDHAGDRRAHVAHLAAPGRDRGRPIPRAPARPGW